MALDLKNRFNLLIDKFFEIKNKGYVKGINNNKTNSCGLTFESLLGKKPDSKYLPDYEEIEIKCKQRFSRYNISLFNLAFDGPYQYEANQLLKKYGKKESFFNRRKTLVVSLKINERVFFNKYYFELNIDKNNELLYVNIYNKYGKFLEKRCFLYFESIKKRVEIKLTNLALIRASKKKENNDLYFRYYKITCYVLKDSSTFISEIEKGNIVCGIMLRYSRSEKDYGKNKNKNMTFSISEYKLYKIYNKVYEFE